MTPEARPVPHASLGASRLFQAVASGAAEALRFYAYDWRTGLSDAADAAAAFPRQRDALADALLAQADARGADGAAQTNIERLRDPRTVAVLTGQQLGLFGGPLYTVWKALGAVVTARRVARETGRPVVPVFWLAGEDHDLDEVRSTAVSSGETVRRVRYGTADPNNREPVGRKRLEAEPLAEALAQMERALPEGPYRNEVLDLLREAWTPGRLWRDAFWDTLQALTRGTGLVFVSPDDPAIKALAADLFAREAEDPQATLDALQSASDALVEAGYHAQIQPGPLNLFWLRGDERLALDPDASGDPNTGAASGAIGRGTAHRISDLAVFARETPEALSPNVVLRPVLQDVLFPTVAYIAGPGETAYFAQLKGVYERFGVPMPAIVPRLSVSLVEPGVRKVLDRYGLDLPDLKGGIDAHWKRLAQEAQTAGAHAASGADLPAQFAAAREAADAELARLTDLAADLNPSLRAAGEAAQARVHKALARLETKTVRVQKRQHDDIRKRLARAHAALWPGGSLQERAANPFAFAVRLGLDGFAQIADALDAQHDLHTAQHWAVDV
ncbi:bacillithiol biosynthesis cysteine-adding enzyme BshC [Rubricoccus marinus]|uniref:Putative cysteine ligase BshC n=1 Tax=Rubricoccus marinus TaxID=716817 RepID=A0A259TVM0_9BACT|nr:bacillithiol biosynthesis cysteine-adding enzyme BshC [Rubricoccus marinus]OZC01771.1 bacillithiol biosynthesis cysteine-adding enzyme BshC [Rubricoccus marinus]